MKKLFALVLAIVMVLTGSALAVYDPAVDSVSNWEGETITITFVDRLPGIQLENNPLLEEIEKRIGVKLDISVLDAAQYNSLIAAQIAAGDIPDMFYLWDNSSNPNFVKWAEDGLIWNLEELADKIPNAFEWLNESDLAYGRVASLDNGLYGLPRMQNLSPDAIPYRADWLEQFGMDVPVTPDDFFEYCVKCATEDPDGNGVDDTYGVFITQLGDKGGGLIDKNIREGFGIEPETVAYSVIQAQEGFMDLMDFYRELYEAGGIYPEFYLESDVYADSAYFNNGTVGTFFKTTSIDHTMLYPSTWESNAFHQNNPEGTIVAGYPLQPNGTTAEDSDNYYHYITMSCWGVFAISKAASEEAVEAACRFLNFGCSDEGVYLLNFGVEDISFKEWIPETRTKVTFTQAEKEEAGHEARLGNWVSYMCVQQSWENYGKLTFNGNTDEEKAEYISRYNALNHGYIVYDNIDTYPGYAELKTANAELTAQLNDEYMVQYIIGKITREEFTEWLNNTYLPAWEGVYDIVAAVKGPKA